MPGGRRQRPSPAPCSRGRRGPGADDAESGGASARGSGGGGWREGRRQRPWGHGQGCGGAGGGEASDGKRGEERGKGERARGGRPQPSRGTQEANSRIARRSTGRWLRGRRGVGAGWWFAGGIARGLSWEMCDGVGRMERASCTDEDRTVNLKSWNVGALERKQGGPLEQVQAENGLTVPTLGYEATIFVPLCVSISGAQHQRRQWWGSPMRDTLECAAGCTAERHAHIHVQEINRHERNLTHPASSGLAHPTRSSRCPTDWVSLP